MPAWKGALDYRGFSVNVAFNAQKKSTRGAGFKIIGPDGQPPVNKSFNATTGEELTKDDTGRAVSIGKGKAAVLHPLTPEAIEAITSNEKTQVMIADSFVPVETLPLELALNAYVVTPDPDVAGAERSATVIWNGLRETKLAYVTQATIASRDSIVAIWATETEMRAVSLPFVQELYPKPAFEWEVNEEMGQVFAETLEETYELKPFFEQEAYASEYEARRNEVVQQVLDGAVVAAPAAKPKAATEDLLEMLKASAKPKAKAKTTKTKTKVAA